MVMLVITIRLHTVSCTVHYLSSYYLLIGPYLPLELRKTQHDLKLFKKLLLQILQYESKNFTFPLMEFDIYLQMVTD